MDDRPHSLPHIAPEREAPRRETSPIALPAHGQAPAGSREAAPEATDSPVVTQTSPAARTTGPLTAPAEPSNVLTAPAEPSSVLTAPTGPSNVLTAPTEPSSVLTAMRLQSGYAIEALPGPVHEALQLRAPDGRVCLRIELTPQGPMVELTAVSLSVATTGSLRLDCERLEINAHEGMSLQSEGRIDLASGAGASIRSQGRIDLTTRDDLRLEAEGDLRGRARAQYLTATEGDVVLDAGEDVMMDGQQIRMNSPRTPGEVQRLLERRAQPEGLLVRSLPTHECEGRYGGREGLPAARSVDRAPLIAPTDTGHTEEFNNPETRFPDIFPGTHTPDGE